MRQVVDLGPFFSDLLFIKLMFPREDLWPHRQHSVQLEFKTFLKSSHPSEWLDKSVQKGAIEKIESARSRRPRCWFNFWTTELKHFVSSASVKPKWMIFQTRKHSWSVEEQGLVLIVCYVSSNTAREVESGLLLYFWEHGCLLCWFLCQICAPLKLVDGLQTNNCGKMVFCQMGVCLWFHSVYFFTMSAFFCLSHLTPQHPPPYQSIPIDLPLPRDHFWPFPTNEKQLLFLESPSFLLPHFHKSFLVSAANKLY